MAGKRRDLPPIQVMYRVDENGNELVDLENFPAAILQVILQSYNLAAKHIWNTTGMKDLPQYGQMNFAMSQLIAKQIAEFATQASDGDGCEIDVIKSMQPLGDEDVDPVVQKHMDKLRKKHDKGNEWGLN